PRLSHLSFCLFLWKKCADKHLLKFRLVLNFKVIDLKRKS
ncbi:hypothetical protein X975_06583, partial [Stegodyphus mimosarum]